MIHARGWLLFGWVSLVCLFGCSKPDRWNVVLVTLDTTRADHLGCYGNQRIKTPVLDQLAKEGVLFERAFSAVPITLPSHSTIMTGKVPFTHGIRDNGLFKMDESQTTLAEILNSAGYQTAAAVGSFPLVAKFGLDQGFDMYDDQLTAAFEDVHGRRVAQKNRLFFDERRAARVNEALLPWLDENHESPFFLWAHYFDPHHPHEPPPPYNQLYADDLYSGEIAYADECLGTLIQKLKDLGVYDKTLIVFTSDHGEGIDEHHETTHSLLVYNSTLHVPLIIKMPGGAEGTRISQRVGLVDLMPTILDVLDLPNPEETQGRSLATALQAKPTEPLDSVPLYAETLSPRYSQNWGELRAIFLDQYKYIHGPRSELYDLYEDPRELNDLINNKPEEANRLKYRLQGYLDTHAIPDLDSSVEMDEETMERLMALGYIQSTGTKVGIIEERLREDGTPPQDRAGDISAYSMVKNFLFQGRPLRAKGLLQNLLANDPDNTHYLDLLVRADLAMGQAAEALTTLERLAELNQGHPPPYQLLTSMGQILLGQGKFQEALEKFKLSQAIKVTPEGQFALAQIYRRLGQQNFEFEHLEKALATDSGFVPARLELAIKYAQGGDLESAENHFLQAIEDQPYHAKAFFNYGAFLVQRERYVDAMMHFERATDLEPYYLKPYQALVDLAMGLGQESRAHHYFQQLNQLAPQSKEAKIAAALLDRP